MANEEKENPIEIAAKNEKKDRDRSSIDRDTKCGLRSLQSLANENSFMIVFGIIGCAMAMTYAYFNGTITTLEKRFHMSSRSIGITQVGKEIMETLTSLFFIHYISKKHRPHWIAIGALLGSLYCLLTTLPHWLYGAGEDALKLTNEFGISSQENLSRTLSLANDIKNLCQSNVTDDPCRAKVEIEHDGHPIFMLFLAQMVGGTGMPIFYTLGYVYMDDNAVKSKAAFMYSFSLFLNLLGPSFGYTLASFCLREYVSPLLTPIIDNNDPRWTGAWWMGWLVLAGFLGISAFIIALFPKELPSSCERKKRKSESLLKSSDHKETPIATKSSLAELLKVLKRIVKNRIFMCNNIAAIFYCFGYMPYWIFTPKYLEIVFRKSTAEANVYTGTIALVFTALGVLISGSIISWKKPKARILASWNAIVGLLTLAGFFSYSFIGCPSNEQSLYLEKPEIDAFGASILGCVDACHCEFTPYAPICGENNLTYISACHAGCKEVHLTEDHDEKLFSECECIGSFQSNSNTTQSHAAITRGHAVAGPCPVDCTYNFLIFMSIMCALKFIGSTSRTSYFLIQMRSVAVEDKTIAIAFGNVMLSSLSFVPSPILFGWLFDRMCLVWGKTCSDQSNCWLYDSKRLRLTLNYSASVFLALGVACDCINCFLVKNLKVFDDNEKKDQDDDEVACNIELPMLGQNI